MISLKMFYLNLKTHTITALSKGGKIAGCKIAIGQCYMLRRPGRALTKIIKIVGSRLSNQHIHVTVRSPKKYSMLFLKVIFMASQYSKNNLSSFRILLTSSYFANVCLCRMTFGLVKVFSKLNKTLFRYLDLIYIFFDNKIKLFSG